MPSNLLERRVQLGLPTSLVTLSPTQILLDQSLRKAGDALSDPIALTAMGVAPVFGKLGRMGSVWGAERWLGAIPQLATKYFGSLAGFGTEVFAFEGIQRSLRVMVEGVDPSLLKWEHLKEGLVHSFINLGILKLGNTATAGTNPILSHFVTDSAMVAGHHVAATLGMMPAPTESWLQQFVQADAMNWQMKGGMSLFHSAFPSLALRERSLELQFNLQTQSPSRFWKVEASSPSMAAEGSSRSRSFSQEREALRPLIDQHLGRLAEHLATQVAGRRYRHEHFLPLHQRIERILSHIYPNQVKDSFMEGDRLYRAANQLHRILETWQSRVPLKELDDILSILEEGLNGKRGMLFVEQNVRQYCRKYPASQAARPRGSKAAPESAEPREIKPYNLRDFQEQMVGNIYEDVLNGVFPWLGLASPMQTGKSFLAGPVIQKLREAYGPKARFIVLTSSKIITKQVVADLLEGFPPEAVGRYDANSKQIRPITVASVHTLVRHLGDFTHEGPTILINDEAYSTQSPMFRAIYTHFGLGEIVQEGSRSIMKPEAGKGVVVGLSGTGAGLDGYKISGQLNILDAIDQGWIRHMRGDRVILSIPAEKRESVEDREMIWWPATEANAEVLADIYDQHLHGTYRRNAIFVPTIKHAELLKEALRKRYGSDYAFAVHSEMEQKGEAGSIDQDFDRVIAHWEQKGGALISIGQLSRGYRGKGMDACFHTYESSSLELFGQRTGRGWAGIPGEELPDYYVLEVTWNPRSRYANLARLLGLADYPLRDFSSRGLRERMAATAERKRERQVLEDQVRERRVVPLFEKIPLVKIWRERFQALVQQAGDLNELATKTGLGLETLAGFALGGLPLYKESVLALKDFLAVDALELWVACWREAALEIRQGIQQVEDRFSQDLVRWEEGKGDFNSLEEVLLKYFPKPKVKQAEILQRGEASSASGEPVTEQAKPAQRVLGPGKARRRKEDLDLDPALSEDLRQKLETSIHSLPVHWSEPCREFFRKFDIQFVADLVQWMEKDLKALENFGPTSLKQIKDALWDLDLMLGMEVKKKAPEVSEAVAEVPKEQEVARDLERKLLMSIDDLEIAIRSNIALEKAKILTVGELVQKTEDELLKLKGFKRSLLIEIKEVLADMGLSLGMKLQGSEISPEAAERELARKLDLPVDKLGLSVRAENGLNMAGIHQVRDLIQNTESDLSKIKNFAPRCVREVKAALARRGLSLKTESAEVAERELARKLDMSIEDLELSVRALNSLNSAGIYYVHELIQRTESDLSKIRNFKKCLREVKDVLADLGFSLKTEPVTVVGPTSDLQKKLELLIQNLEWSDPTREALHHPFLITLGDLVELTEKDVLTMLDTNEACLREIKTVF